MSRGQQLPPMVRTVGWLAGLLFLAGQLALLLVVRLPLADSILLAVLLVAVPAFTLAQLPLIEGARVERLPAYWGSIATLGLLGTASWVVGTRLDGPAALGIVGLPVVPLLTSSVVLTLAGLLTILVFRRLALWTGADESPVLRELLPRTRAEKVVFALLSVAAGIGEELAYRGYAIPVLAPALGTGGAVVLTSVVFGVLHAYQGGLGMLRTATMGGILAWGFLVSESLWPAIIAHVSIDVIAGIVLGERLLPPVPSRGVGNQPIPASE